MFEDTQEVRARRGWDVIAWQGLELVGVRKFSATEVRKTIQNFIRGKNICYLITSLQLSKCGGPKFLVCHLQHVGFSPQAGHLMEPSW